MTPANRWRRREEPRISRTNKAVHTVMLSAVMLSADLYFSTYSPKFGSQQPSERATIRGELRAGLGLGKRFKQRMMCADLRLRSTNDIVR